MNRASRCLFPHKFCDGNKVYRRRVGRKTHREGAKEACVSYSSPHHTFCVDSTSHLAGAEKQNPIFNEPIKCLEHQWAWGGLTFH